MEEEQHIAKGKRTKRLRLLSPCGATVMTSSCSSGDNNNANSFSSNESTDQEEEDMANCLILLAQGRGAISHHHQQHQDQGNNKISNRKFAEVATPSATPNGTINTKVGFYIYECKTCNRTFPSFQALGGHRASHKKPKLVTSEEKKPPPPPSPPSPPSPLLSQPKMIANYDEIGEAEQIHMKIGPPISLQLGNQSHRAFHGNNKAKIHECSICGSEFTSGQALGGHMRRHRAASTNITTTETSSNTAIAANREVQHRNILELDLNLPAPEDDLRESKFQFPATQKSMVLSAAPALVDCHY